MIASHSSAPVRSVDGPNGNLSEAVIPAKPALTAMSSLNVGGPTVMGSSE